MTRRRPSPHTHYTHALAAVKEGENMIAAGRFDDALDLYRLGQSRINESRDERAPELRRIVVRVIAYLEKKLGAVKAPGPAPLAKTQPEAQPDDLGTVFGLHERREHADLILDIDEENLRKGTG